MVHHAVQKMGITNQNHLRVVPATANQNLLHAELVTVTRNLHHVVQVKVIVTLRPHPAVPDKEKEIH